MRLQVMGSLVVVKIFECLNDRKNVNPTNSIVLLKHWIKSKQYMKHNRNSCSS